MSSRPSHHSSRRPSPAAILLIPIVVALVLTLFAWPSARLGPRDLPIGVAGPEGAARAVEHRLAARDGAVDLRRYADEARARRAIADREVYGALVVTPTGAKMLIASAASPAVAQALSAAGAPGERPGAAAIPAEDVVPASHAAAALPSSVLPLVLAGIVTGILAGVLAGGSLARRAGLVVAGSALAGLTATAIVQGWLDVVGGDWLANAAGLSLTVLAIAAFVTGLHALLGERGAIAGALTMILIGNAFSGVGAAPELLPRPVGDLGQLMPPGAGGNLLRSTGLFDGAAAGGHVAVLAAWAAAGLALLLVAGRGMRAAARHASATSA
jgi:hypothetical protein